MNSLYSDSMTVNPSRLVGAQQEAQDIHPGISSSPGSEQESIKECLLSRSPGLGKGSMCTTLHSIKDSGVAQANANDTFHEAEDYVASVMSSQPLVEILNTPSSTAASGRKRHLSMPTVSGTDLKKLRSDINCINLDQRRLKLIVVLKITVSRAT